MIKALDEGVVTPAKEHAAERSIGDVRAIVSVVRAGLVEEQRLLADPNALAEGAGRARAGQDPPRVPARTRRASGASIVGDRVADLSNDITYQFRAAMRSVSDGMDEQIEALTKGTEWDEMVRDMQTQVADAVTEAFVAIEHGCGDIEAEVVELLQEEQLGLPERPGRDHSVDVSNCGPRSPSTRRRATGKRAFQTGVTGIRGVQSGMYMFSSIGSWLPTAAGALLIANPVLLGAGALFGGMQLLDERKKKVTARRQSARQQVRQFLDDVQFEVGNEITTMVREVQRDLRDEFTDRLGELQRTYTETGAARAGRRAEDRSRNGSSDRAQVAQMLAALDAIEQPRVVTADGHRAGVRLGGRPGAANWSTRSRADASGSRARVAAGGDPRTARRTAARRDRRAGEGRASRRCSTRSSASGWRPPTPASARASSRGTAGARATR